MRLIDRFGFVEGQAALAGRAPGDPIIPSGDIPRSPRRAQAMKHTPAILEAPPPPAAPGQAPGDIMADLLGGSGAQLIDTSLIRTDGATQPRAGLDPEVLDDYEIAMKAGAVFPPIEVVYDGTYYWPWDGFHRVYAGRRAGLGQILARIQQGDQALAQWLSYSANQTHGLRRSSADKARAVVAALRHPNGASLADSAIAKHTGVDPKTVAKYRAELQATMEIPKSDVRTGSDGRAINTSKIGPKPALGRPGQPGANPEAPAWASPWELEQIVKRWLGSFEGEEGSAESALAEMKAEPASIFWADLGDAVDSAPEILAHRKRDLRQAVNNVLAQLRADRSRGPVEAAAIGSALDALQAGRVPGEAPAEDPAPDQVPTLPSPQAPAPESTDWSDKPMADSTGRVVAQALVRGPLEIWVMRDGRLVLQLLGTRKDTVGLELTRADAISLGRKLLQLAGAEGEAPC